MPLNEVLLLTEWPALHLSELVQRLRNLFDVPAVVDGRERLRSQVTSKLGFEYLLRQINARPKLLLSYADTLS